MKVLIIGGTGLISTAITRQLLERGDDVTMFNRGQSEVRVTGKLQQLRGDRRDYNSFESIMAEHIWDAVIDMIGFVPEDAESAIRAFRGRTGQYLFCSTVCVYGGPLSRIPAREDEERIPTGSYGKNKALCEDLLLNACRSTGFRATILRPSHTYGEGGGIVHSLGSRTSFIDRIRRGLPVVVHGDGSSLWASCHIDDVAAGFIGALGNVNAIGNCYNLTGEEWRTWNEYVHGVARAISGTANIVHIPTDVLARWAPSRASSTAGIFQYNSVFDNSLAQRDLDFNYAINWEEGVKRTVDWLEARGRIEKSEVDPFYEHLVAAWTDATENAQRGLKEE